MCYIFILENMCHLGLANQKGFTLKIKPKKNRNKIIYIYMFLPLAYLFNLTYPNIDLNLFW